MKKSVRIIVFLICLTSFNISNSLLCYAQDVVKSAASNSASKDFWFFDPPKEWSAQVMPGLRGGTEKLKTYIDNLVPLVGAKNIIVFADVKTVIGPNGSNEQNIGSGVRDLLFDEKLILGGNFFYDTRYTENKARHHQLAFGLEGLTKWIDLRSNFYFPVSGRQKVDVAYSFRERSLVEVDSYEEPLTGLDYEAGVLIPLVSDYCETRFFMGGYNYFPGVGKSLNGIKGRIEIRPVKGITLNFELKNDNYSNTNFYVEGVMSIPLDEMNLFKIKNPLTEFCRYFSYKKGIRPLRERMVDRIVRDIDVAISPAPDKTESKVHDLTYVDNSYTSGSSDGTLSRPYTTIADGITHVTGDKWVYVKKGSGDYSENVALANNVVLWGSGYNGGFNNISGTGYPIIDTSGKIVTLANNNTVMGLQIQNGEYGIYGSNVTGANIKYNNILDNSNTGVYFVMSSNSSRDLTISNNTLSSNATNNIALLSTSGSAVADISNNIMTGASYGIRLMAGQNSSITADLTYNNISSASTYGVYINATPNLSSTPKVDIVLFHNIVTDCGTSSGYGIYIYVKGTGIGRISMSRSTITNNAGTGISWSDSTASDCIIDFGGGSLGSEGYNSCYGNTSHDASAYTVNMVSATNNWWGTASPSDSQFLNPAYITYVPYLTSDPN
jgi:hypothetical protein